MRFLRRSRVSFFIGLRLLALSVRIEMVYNDLQRATVLPIFNAFENLLEKVLTCCNILCIISTWVEGGIWV